MGCLFKKRSVDDEPVFVDEEPPTIYFDPNDPSIGIINILDRENIKINYCCYSTDVCFSNKA